MATSLKTIVEHLHPCSLFNAYASIYFEEPLTEIKIAAINYLAEATHHLWQLEGGIVIKGK